MLGQGHKLPGAKSRNKNQETILRSGVKINSSLCHGHSLAKAAQTPHPESDHSRGEVLCLQYRFHRGRVPDRICSPV